MKQNENIIGTFHIFNLYTVIHCTVSTVVCVLTSFLHFDDHVLIINFKFTMNFFLGCFYLLWKLSLWVGICERSYCRVSCFYYQNVLLQQDHWIPYHWTTGLICVLWFFPGHCKNMSLKWGVCVCVFVFTWFVSQLYLWSPYFN